MSEIPRGSADVQQNKRVHIAAILALCSLSGCTEDGQSQVNVYKDNNMDLAGLTDTDTGNTESVPEKPGFLKIVEARAGLAKDKTTRIILDVDNGKSISSFECPVKPNCLEKNGDVGMQVNSCDEHPLLNGTINCADLTKGCTEVEE